MMLPTAHSARRTRSTSPTPTFPAPIALAPKTLVLKGIIATPGDTDLNGQIDFDDYSRTDVGFNTQPGGWENGDFNGDGTIDFDDYSLIDVSFNTQGGGGMLMRAMRWLSGEDHSERGMNSPPLQMVEQHFNEFGESYAQAFIAAVPEPATIALILPSTASLLLRRSNRRRAGARRNL